MNMVTHLQYSDAESICIFHKSCADGFGAALAVKHFFDLKGLKCEFLAAHYGDAAPDVKGKNVIIVDFSYPRDVLLQMESEAEKILVIDHHHTAKEALKGLDFCIFDMNSSGAALTWRYFHSPDLPDLIAYIQDRDLWRWELENSKAFSSALQSLPFDFEDWHKLLDNKEVEKLVDTGKIILEYQETLINNATDPSKLSKVNLCGYTVPCTNTTVLISEICGRLAENQPFAATYFDTPTDRIYSLRSREDGEDVSEIAKCFGGGGHKQAAGFKLNFKLDKQKIEDIHNG